MLQNQVMLMQSKGVYRKLYLGVVVVVVLLDVIIPLL
jgi:hypothetical protein